MPRSGKEARARLEQAALELYLERGFDASRALDLIESQRITTTMGVPANYLFIAQEPRFPDADLSSLRLAVVGGAPMPVPLLDTWAARGVDIVQGYGLTEAAPNVLCLPPEDARRKAGWAGKPYPYVRCDLSAEGERRLTGWVTGALAAVPDDVPPWPALRRAIDLVVPHLEESGRAGTRLAAIVAATPALRERAAAKEANLVALVARLLVERGAGADEADLVALTEWGVLAHAIRTWRADPGSPLQRHVDRGFALLGGLVGA